VVEDRIWLVEEEKEEKTWGRQVGVLSV